MDINNGSISVANGADFGEARQKDYTDNRYHQQQDNYSDRMDVTGMMQVAGIMYQIGTKLSSETTFPGWKPGSEFKAIRDKAMGK